MSKIDLKITPFTFSEKCQMSKSFINNYKYRESFIFAWINLGNNTLNYYNTCRESTLHQYRNVVSNNSKIKLSLGFRFSKEEAIKALKKVRGAEKRIGVPESEKSKFFYNEESNLYVIELNWWAKNYLRIDVLTLIVKDTNLKVSYKTGLFTRTKHGYFDARVAQALKTFLDGKTKLKRDIFEFGSSRFFVGNFRGCKKEFIDEILVEE